MSRLLIWTTGCARTLLIGMMMVPACNSSRGCCNRTTITDPVKPAMSNKSLAKDVSLLVAASGATHLVLAADGSIAVAELSGRWLKEEYGAAADQAPPVLKVIDIGRDQVTATATGWLLAPPGPTHAGFYLAEVGEELQYQVRGFQGATLQWTPPAGLWAVKFTATAAGRLLIGLWRPASRQRDAEPARQHPPYQGLQELYLASLDPLSSEPAVTTILTGRFFGFNGTTVRAAVAVSPVSGTIYLAEERADEDAAPAWLTVHALDAKTMDRKWSARCERPTGGLAAATGNLAVHLTSSGDGNYLLVLAGASAPHGVNAERGFVFDGRSGTAQGELSAPAVASLWTVGAVVPAGGEAVGVSSFVEGGIGPARSLRFLGLRTILTAQKRVLSGFEPGPMAPAAAGNNGSNELLPTAFAWEPVRGGWLVAASSFAWVKSQGLEAPISTSERAFGRDRPEVQGLVLTPPTWHRPGRPRIEQWQREAELQGSDTAGAPR